MGDKTEKTVEEIEDEKSAIEEEIEQIRVANAFLEDSRMMSHSTPRLQLYWELSEKQFLG